MKANQLIKGRLYNIASGENSNFYKKDAFLGVGIFESYDPTTEVATFTNVITFKSGNPNGSEVKKCDKFKYFNDKDYINLKNTPPKDFKKYTDEIEKQKKIYEAKVVINQTTKETPQSIIIESKPVTTSEIIDDVNHPPHYTWLKDLCGIEVIDITMHMKFTLGNAIKYILRQGRKIDNSLTQKESIIKDLKKAIWYINKEIETIENS